MGTRDVFRRWHEEMRDQAKVQMTLGRKEQREVQEVGPEMPGDMTRVRETWKMRGRWIREGGGQVGGAAGRDDKTRKE